MILAKEDRKYFKAAIECRICNNKYTETNIRVRDHCHLTGKYRGAAPQDCKIKLFKIDKIPVIFHNLRDYKVLRNLRNS